MLIKTPDLYLGFLKDIFPQSHIGHIYWEDHFRLDTNLQYSADTINCIYRQFLNEISVGFVFSLYQFKRTQRLL